MKAHEIESWALNVIDRVRAGQPNEDSRVELKADWPEPQKTARLIAGHANAARGEPTLWLVGVDQKSGVKGASYMELANWFEQVKAQFDGLAPLLTDLNIPVDGNTVVALLFETDRAPFVVRNPAFGKPEGGPVALEVPWRENTSTKSATRAQLIQLLSPLQKLPDFEVLRGDFWCDPIDATRRSPAEWLDWQLDLRLYVSPRSSSRVFIPFHRCEASFEFSVESGRIHFGRVSLSTVTNSMTIGTTGTEILIDGPGLVNLYASVKTPEISDDILANAAQIDVVLRPLETEHSVSITRTLPLRPPLKPGSNRKMWSSENYLD